MFDEPSAKRSVVLLPEEKRSSSAVMSLLSVDSECLHDGRQWLNEII